MADHCVRHSPKLGNSVMRIPSEGELNIGCALTGAGEHAVVLPYV